MIPKIFHRAWVGPNPIPDVFQKYWAGWQKLHPNWNFVTWGEEDIDNFGLTNQAEYDSATEYAGKTDIAMYEILYRCGGVWLCCDMECFKNIESLVDNVEGFCGLQRENIFLGAIMGCVPGHPLWKSMVDGILESVRTHAGAYLPEITGPFYMTRIVQEQLKMSVSDIVAANYRGFRVYDTKLVYPYHPTDVSGFLGATGYPNSYCCHHWRGSWVK